MTDAVRQYAVPLLLALALHAAAVLGLLRGFHPTAETTRVIKPRIIESQLIVLEPRAAPQPKSKPKPKPIVQAPPPAETRPDPQPVAQPAEKPAQPQRDPAAERRAAEDKARQERLDALARASFETALASADDAPADAPEVDAAADEQAAQSFRTGIYQRVVANWSRPPSARQGMEVKLRVELVPTGDVVAVSLLESSGNSAFDRSAEAAVRKARRFEVPQDSALFERHFRRFTLLFRPEDLLR